LLNGNGHRWQSTLGTSTLGPPVMALCVGCIYTWGVPGVWCIRHRYKQSERFVVADSRVYGMVWRALGGMDACANHVMVCYHASKTMSFPLPLRAVSLGPLKQTFRHQSWLDHSPGGKTTQTQTQTQHRRHFLHSKFLPKAEFKQKPEKHPDYPQNFPKNGP